MFPESHATFNPKSSMNFPTDTSSKEPHKTNIQQIFDKYSQNKAIQLDNRVPFGNHSVSDIHKINNSPSSKTSKSSGSFTEKYADLISAVLGNNTKNKGLAHSELTLGQNNLFPLNFDSNTNTNTNSNSNSSLTFADNRLTSSTQPYLTGSEQIQPAINSKPPKSIEDVLKSSSQSNMQVADNLMFLQSQKNPFPQSLQKRRSSFKDTTGTASEFLALTSERGSVNQVIRNNMNSSAIAGAMKALQEKLQAAENEIIHLKEQLGDGNFKGKEGAINKRELNEENYRLKAQLDLLKNELGKINKENLALKKEKEMIQYEKNCYHQRNEEERELFQKYIEDILKKLEVERKQNQDLKEQISRLGKSSHKENLEKSPNPKTQNRVLTERHKKCDENLNQEVKKVKSRKPSPISRPSSIDKKKVEELECENNDLRVENNKVKDDLAKLQRKLSGLKNMKAKLVKEKQTKSASCQQSIAASQQLMPKLNDSSHSHILN